MVKRKIEWSSQAKIDLSTILEFFYIRNGSKIYSKKLNSKLRKAIRLLSKHPLLGIQSDVDNIRTLVEGDYAIFYQLTDDSVRIITIWDCRQNPDNLTIQK
jgi:plasmid stabilization system protein ParE